jgi:prevent-host-death family protein
LREHGGEIVNRVAYGGEELVLTRRGKPIAALVSLAALEALHRLEDARDVAEAARRERTCARTARSVGRTSRLSFAGFDLSRRIDPRRR